MFGLSVIDVVVLVLYIAVVFYIAIRANRRVRSAEDYLTGGRRFGRFVSTFASFGQATSADGPVGVATTTFNNGAAGIWSSLFLLFATPLFWITSPWLRRLRVITMGDFYTERYGSKKMAATYALVASIGMMSLLSAGYLAVSKTVMAITSKPVTELTVDERSEQLEAAELHLLEKTSLDQLSSVERERLEFLRNKQPKSTFSYWHQETIIWSICILVVLYTAIGGLEAAFYTDILQGIFILILSVVLIPFALNRINLIYDGVGFKQAFSHLHLHLPESTFEIFGSPQTIDFTWYFILTIALVSGVTVVAQPNQLVTTGAAKNEFAARLGFVSGTFLKRLVTILWGVLGLIALLLYHSQISDPDVVWGHAVKDLLSPLKIGLTGLVLASLVAALMSTADCLMITVSGLIMNNLYKPFFKNTSEEKLVWIGRVSGALFLIGGAAIAFQFDSLLQILKFIWEFFVIFAAAFWLGLKWRRANAFGAWVSILGSLAIFYLIPIFMSLFVSGVKLEAGLLKQTNPVTITRTYSAKQRDVYTNQELITRWENGDEHYKKTHAKPVELFAGKEFEKVYQIPRKSIFWSKGIKQLDTGQLEGRGYLYLELILLEKLGFDLIHNPYALNETIRLLIRLIVPFILLIVASLLTAPVDKEVLTKFFVKMRTKVGEQLDYQKVDLDSYKSDLLLFKNTYWELYRWDEQDVAGFIFSCLMVIVMVGLLHWVVLFGSY